MKEVKGVKEVKAADKSFDRRTQQALSRLGRAESHGVG